MKKNAFLCLLLILFNIIPAIAEENTAIQSNESNKSSDRMTGIENASTSTMVQSGDMAARSDSDLSDSLNMVPGIEAALTLQGEKGFSMRGYSQDKVAVLVDGILVNDAYESKADISQIPVINISHFIVNRGVSSALYGTYGTIGSVNVITKKPEKLFTEANIKYGEYKNYQINAAHGNSFEKFFYWVTASMSNSDGYKISSKLDSDERRKWFDKIVRYDLYGISYDEINLKTSQNYINDTGKWNHNEYRKYILSGKTGYSFSDKSEAGISCNYNNGRFKNTVYDANLYSSYSSGEWHDPSASAYQIDGKSAALQVQARNWPEDYAFKTSPYFNYTGISFSLKTNLFMNYQSNILQSFSDTDHTTFMYSPSTYYWDSAGNNAAPYWGNFFDSRHTDISTGVQVQPSYKFSRRFKLGSALIYRRDAHTEEERAFEDGSAGDIISVYGTGYYKTKYLEVHSVTTAAEGEAEPLDNLYLSAGISYDAQKLTDHKRRSMDENTLNQYTDGYIAEEDSIIWGTRDSFNPVVGATYRPGNDFLILRAAASKKTRFPTLKAYSRLSDMQTDMVMKPEKSYNSNAGFELVFMNERLKARLDYFYTKYDDKIDQAFNEKLGGLYSVNLEGAETSGMESIFTADFKKIASLFSLKINASYTYVYTENRDNSANIRLNMGDEFELNPKHVITADLRIFFDSGTGINIFGKYTKDQFMYAMKYAPATGDNTADSGDEVAYSTDCFKKVPLHDPIMLNIKVSQALNKNFSTFVMCTNILDDYNADPFNPGPGRMWHFGGSTKM